MPIKSTFAAEIGEGVDKFKDFEKLFEKYRERLGKTPSAWASMSKTNKETENSFKAMTAALLAQSEIMKSEEKVQRRIETSAKNISQHWRDSYTHARSFYSTLSSIATNKIVLGLLGLGGTLWGLDRLGSAAGSGRKTSTGLGLNYGDMTSFGLTYNRVMEPGSFLAAISQARGNIGGGEASALMALGINPMAGGDSSKAARDALRKIYDMARGTPEHLLGPMMHEGFGIGNLGMSIEDLRRLKGMSRPEFERYSGQFDARSNQLGIGDGTLRKWQDFVNTLDVTGKRIESSLIRGLVGATAPLERLSDAAARLVEKFVGSKSFEWVMDKLTQGMEWFAKYLTDGSMQRDLLSLRDGLVNFAKFLDRWFGSSQGGGSTSSSMAPMTYDAWVKQREEGAKQYDPTLSRPDTQRYLQNHRKSYNDYLKQQGQYNYDIWGGKGGASSASMLGMSDMLDLVAKLEGSPDINGKAQVSPAGAIGKYQIMPSTAKGYGVDRSELFDSITNKATATRILTDLGKRYQSTAQILAAYNAGPMIADYMKAHGDKSIPSRRPDTGGTWDYGQTQDYLRRAGFKVTIDNPAGADVSTQNNQLGGSYPGLGSVP